MLSPTIADVDADQDDQPDVELALAGQNRRGHERGLPRRRDPQRLEPDDRRQQIAETVRQAKDRGKRTDDDRRETPHSHTAGRQAPPPGFSNTARSDSPAGIVRPEDSQRASSRSGCSSSELSHSGASVSSGL